jgi:hypothetical protein
MEPGIDSLESVEGSEIRVIESGNVSVWHVDRI